VSHGSVTGKWESTATAGELAGVMRQARRAVVVTHAKPDGDAAGSTLAVARTLQRLRVDTEVWYVGPSPRWLAEFADPTPVRLFEPGKPCTPADGRDWDNPTPDLVVIVDTGSWSQLAELRPWLAERTRQTVVIDHHVQGDAEVSPRRLIRTSAASCTEVLGPVCCALLERGSAAGLPEDVAEALYLGLATDTGWFRYASVRPPTLRLAADLLEAGVNHTRLFRMIEQQDSAPRWKLLGRSLSSLELFAGGTVAVQSLSAKDFAECHAEQGDTGGFADMVLAVESVRVSCVLTEVHSRPGEASATKISCRSKPGENAVDVNAALKTLGGGGHVLAAGAKVAMALPEAKAAALKALGVTP
jgi:bifunctional oligoribonuclease and PAP phosphatase NrnA